jgi:hypothetical protein
MPLTSVTRRRRYLKVFGWTYIAADAAATSPNASSHARSVATRLVSWSAS